MHPPTPPGNDARPTASVSARRRLVLGSAAACALPWRWAQAQQPAPARGPLTPRALAFPRDHGTHNDTRTEWWYLTGHAQDAQGRSFGFQVTFFRSRVDGTQGLTSRLAAKQLVFAHAAITDVSGQRLWHSDRIARWNGEPAEAPELQAHAAATDTDVRLRGWSLQRQPDAGSYRTQIRARDFALALDAAVGKIEKRLMTWQPKAGETEKL